MALLEKIVSKILPENVWNSYQIYKTQKGWDKCEKEFSLKRKIDINSVPVPHINKRNIINEYSKKYEIKVLIETGTFLGIMVNSMKNKFEKIYSVELSEILYKRAVKKFKNDNNIKIVFGNSEIVLPELLSYIDQPCLFWLDGHYSGGITAKALLETPIIKELSTIFEHKIKSHLILIDDARLFIGTRDYPDIVEIKKFIDQQNQNYKLEIKDDIIIISK